MGHPKSFARVATRIEALKEEFLQEIVQRAGQRNFEQNQLRYEEMALTRAIVRYLAELAETDRRRALVNAALANIGEGCTAENTNPLLEDAGLGRVINNGDSFETCRGRILAAAKAADLL